MQFKLRRVEGRERGEESGGLQIHANISGNTERGEIRELDTDMEERDHF